MYICLCNAVTEKHIECAVEKGACRMRDLRNELGVAADCARCAESARHCLASALERRSEQSWGQRTCAGIGTGALGLEAS